MPTFEHNPVTDIAPIPDKPGWKRVGLDVGGVHQHIELRDDLVPHAIEQGKTHFTVPDLPWLKKGGKKK